MIDVWLDEELESIGCPACGGSRASLVQVRFDKLSLYQCGDCGLAFVNPQPSLAALKRYYAGGYFEGNADFHAGSDYFALRSQGVRDGTLTGQEVVTPWIESGKTTVLEVGSSDGALLEWLRKKGAAKVMGVELDQKAAEYCRAVRKIDVFNGEIQEFHSPDKFDLVIAIDLFEHVKSLRMFIAACSQHLNVGGRIVAITPNFGAFEYWGNQWAGIQSNPEHLLYLNARSLENAARSVGLKIENLYYRGHALKMANYRRCKDRRWFKYIANPTVLFGNAYQKIRQRFAPASSRAEMVFVLRKN